MSILIALAVIGLVIGLVALAQWAFNNYCCHSSSELEAMREDAATQTVAQRRRHTLHLQGIAEGLRHSRERDRRNGYFGLEGLL